MRFRRSRLPAVLTVLVLSVLAACSDDEPAPPATPTPTPSPTLSPAAQLSALAQTGLDEAYVAVFALRSDKSRDGTVLVRRTPSAYRLDVTVRGRPTAILVHNKRGTFSCTNPRKGRTTCFKVADGNEPVPAIFNAGQQVFTAYLATFAADATKLRVTRAPGAAARGSVPAGSCFVVKVPATLNSKLVDGTYCLSATGIPTMAAFPSGTFVMQRLQGAPQVEFTPPTRPTPLPK